LDLDCVVDVLCSNVFNINEERALGALRHDGNATSTEVATQAVSLSTARCMQGARNRRETIRLDIFELDINR